MAVHNGWKSLLFDGWLTVDVVSSVLMANDGDQQQGLKVDSGERRLMPG